MNSPTRPREGRRSPCCALVHAAPHAWITLVAVAIENPNKENASIQEKLILFFFFIHRHAPGEGKSAPGETGRIKKTPPRAMLVKRNDR